ncbi:MAG: hypothetical protein R3B70_08640 [Polyangiaceae bacterium]
MADILAIISKAIFEQQAMQGGNLLGPGAVLPLDRYVSKNKALAPLGQGGRLVLVTVRPPNERLWLVAVLEGLSLTKDGWVAEAPNRIPITNISNLRKTIKLANGKGVSQAKGALGMSLQTPRALAPEDVEAMLAAVAEGGPENVMGAVPAQVSSGLRAVAEELAKAPDDDGLRERVVRGLLAEGYDPAAKKLLARMKQLHRHDPSASLPCLCKQCFSAAPKEVDAAGISFGRDFVLHAGRVLHFWAPKEVLALGNDATRSVRAALVRQLRRLARERKLRAREAGRLRAEARG